MSNVYTHAYTCSCMVWQESFDAIGRPGMSEWHKKYVRARARAVEASGRCRIGINAAVRRCHLAEPTTAAALKGRGGGGSGLSRC